MTRHRLLATLLGFLLLGGGQGLCMAQTRYATAQLRRLAERTGIEAPATDGLHYRAAEWDGLPVTVAVKEGVVTHIGHSLFTPHQRSCLPEAQCNFIERLLLASSLPDFYGKTFSRHLQEEGITLSASSLRELRSRCLDTGAYFQTTLENGKRHVWSWYVHDRDLATRITATLAYPTDAQLILGATLEEMEAVLPREAPRFRVEPGVPEERPTSQYHPVGGTSIYVAQGDLFHIPELNSNRYYTLDSTGRFRLLQGEQWPCETLANLATGTELESGIEVEVLLVLYNFRTATLRLPLRQYVGYCMAQGCKPYFGIIANEGGTVTAELVMNNEAMGYAHVMKLTIGHDVIQQNRGLAKARMNSYVPMSNVKSLFNENNR